MAGHRVVVTPMGAIAQAKKNHAAPRLTALKTWNQGFGTISVAGVEVVPFITEEKARRMMAQAAAAVKQQMILMTLDGIGFGFYRAPE